MGGPAKQSRRSPWPPILIGVSLLTTVVVALTLRTPQGAVREFEGGDNGLKLLHVPATNVGRMHFAYSMASPHGIKEVHTSLDGAAPNVIPRQGASVWDNYFLEDLKPGPHHMKVTVVDGKGQRFSQVTRSITLAPDPDGIDPRRPDIRITGPATREVEEEIGDGPDHEFLVIPIEAQDDEDLFGVRYDVIPAGDPGGTRVASALVVDPHGPLRIDLTHHAVPRGTYQVFLTAEDYGGRTRRAEPLTFTY